MLVALAYRCSKLEEEAKEKIRLRTETRVQELRVEKKRKRR